LKSKNNRTCLNCGMFVSGSDRQCPKCDSILNEQTDGSIVTVDIAHHGERVYEAIAKLDDLIAMAKSDVIARLRLVVGSGTIKNEVCAHLSTCVFRGEIIRFEPDPLNDGVVLVDVRKL